MSSSQAYLLIGKERFLKKEFLADLRKRLFSGNSDPSLNSQEFTAGDEPLGSALDFVVTAPFLSEKRLAILWQVEDLSEEEQKTLLASLEKLPPTGVLALLSEETGVKKNSFLKELSTKCRLVACHPPFERELPDWIDRRAKRRGVAIEKAATQVLMEKTGRQTALLDSSIEELAIFVDPRKTITALDVRSLLGRSVQEDIFSLTDFLLEKKIPEALETLEKLLKDGTSASEIIAVLAGQWARLAAYSELKRQGCAEGEIALEMKVHPFYQEKFFAQASKTREGEAERSLRRLLECDDAIKTGRLNDRLAVEKFVLETESRLTSRA